MHIATAALSNVVGRPGMFDLTGKAKWDAWESKKGERLSCKTWVVLVLIVTIIIIVLLEMKHVRIMT